MKFDKADLVFLMTIVCSRLDWAVNSKNVNLTLKCERMLTKLTKSLEKVKK